MTNGITIPTSKPMIAATPGDSAIQSLKNQQTIQANNNRLLAGGKYKTNKKKTRKRFFKKTVNRSLKIKSRSLKKRKYRGGSIKLPQFNMLYQPQGGPGTDPNALLVKNALIQSQANANAVNDNKAFRGGKKTKKTKRCGNKGFM